jgi:hypothetical protein
MTKTAILAVIVAALATSAHAQQRVFVSGLGLDTNPCTVTQPCRTFQQAYNIAAANAEINVLDPAGYGPLTITKGISIQGHGWGGITQTSNPGAAITISVTTGDPVTLNGLLLDGGGTGQYGILIGLGPSVQILNSVVRHFGTGISDNSGPEANLLIEDTIASDNATGISICPCPGGVNATLNRITANNNRLGVVTGPNSPMTIANTTIANSVLSNNSNTGLQNNTGTAAWLAKTVISGNATGVSGTVNSYGDNYISDPVNGFLLITPTK